MFGRQWFSRESQSGLTSDGLEFEDFLVRKQYHHCWNILKQSTDLSKTYKKRQAYRLMHIQHRKHGKPIKIGFTEFWHGFKHQNLFIFNLIREAAEDISAEICVSSELRDCDIVIYSCFPENQEACSILSPTKILYLGENVRPYYYDFDYSFSSDIFAYHARNQYLPVWLSYIMENEQIHKNLCDFQSRFSSLKDLFGKHIKPYSQRDYKVTFVGNNYEPLRSSVLTELKNSNIPVEIYGSQTKPLASKYKAYGKSQYVLCPENSYYPGYVTEKLIDSVLSGAISIYWGGISEDIIKNLADGLIYIRPEINLNCQLIRNSALEDIAANDRISRFERQINQKASQLIDQIKLKLAQILDLYSV